MSADRLREGQPQKRVGFFGWLKRLIALCFLVALGIGGYWIWDRWNEAEILKQIVARLTTDRRVAEVAVEDYQKDAAGALASLTLKIVEFDAAGKPAKPVMCHFTKNDIVHFEALVVRLDDKLVMDGQGKSVHLFRRAFALSPTDNSYEACDINKPMEVPGGYALQTTDRDVVEGEARFWRSFWQLALSEEQRQAAGVRNAQIEAPATRFVPDMLYRLQLEADGGLFISASPVPEVLKKPVLQAPPRPEEPRPAP
jgi:hypothetical protein